MKINLMARIKRINLAVIGFPAVFIGLAIMVQTTNFFSIVVGLAMATSGVFMVIAGLTDG